MLMDVELGGIPAHLWGIDTAEHLLGGHCIVQGLHPDAVDGTDLSVLKLKAWGFSMDCLPSRCDLHVEEPTSIGEDGSCFPRTLIYSISVKVTTPVVLPVEEQPLFSSPDDDDDRDNKHQRQRQHVTDHQFSSVRTSVHARLGPRITPGGGGGTVDAAPLPNSSVDELQAPVPSFPGCPPSPVLGAPFIDNTGPLPASVGVSDVSTGGKTADITLEPFSGNALVPLVSSFNLEEQSASRILVSSWDYKIRAKPPCFKVYVRKKIPVQIAQSEEIGNSTPLQKFKDGITKQINGILPAPIQQVKRKRKLIPSNFNLRRSRRVAKIPPELGSPSAAKVCKLLGFCDDRENISFTDARRYAKLFDSPLSREHITALVALFGWEVPPPGQS